MDKLALELLEQICNHLDIEYVALLRASCKSLRRMLTRVINEQVPDGSLLMNLVHVIEAKKRKRVLVETPYQAYCYLVNRRLCLKCASRPAVASFRSTFRIHM